MDSIQFYETQEDGTKIPLTAIYHKDEREGLTRKVDILELGEGEREDGIRSIPGMAVGL